MQVFALEQEAIAEAAGEVRGDFEGQVIAGNFVRVSIFSGTDRFLGFLFGLLRGAVVVGALVILAQTLRFDQEPYWKNSRLLPYAAPIASVLRGLVGERWSAPQPPMIEPAAATGVQTGEA